MHKEEEEPLGPRVSQRQPRPNPSAADYGVACLAEGSALARGPVLGPRGTVGWPKKVYLKFVPLGSFAQIGLVYGRWS